MNLFVNRCAVAMVALALLASACSSTTAVEEAQPATATQTPAAATATPQQAPAPAEPTVTVEPTTPAVEAFTGEGPPAAAVPPEWTDEIVLDADVRQGTLANGVKYLVRTNSRPGRQAQLRLVVHAGSLNEEPGDEGVAHFLEHMMFNGTERFPGNELVQVLEGFGSGFGPDLNAYTSFEETVYELEVPSSSSDTLQLGLDVLFQWATAATIAPDAVIAERGVVREEQRRRVETLAGRLGAETRDVLLDGTPYLNRLPIGEVDVIEQMTAEQVRSFYEQWYRPELMTIVAVGDFDAGDMEQRIAETFVQPASTSPVSPFDLGPALQSLPEPVFDVFTDSEVLQSEVEVIWRLADSAQLTTDDVRTNLLGSVAMSMVNTRLFERLQGGESVFLSASAGASGYTSINKIVTLATRTSPDDLEVALAELLTEIERARQFGFTQDELDRTLGSIRATIEQTYAERSTRQDSTLAADLVEYALGAAAAPDATSTRDIGLAILDSITIQDAQRFLFQVLESDPYVLVTGSSSDEPELPLPEELAAVYSSVVGVVVEEGQRSVGVVDELLTAPEPAAVIDTQVLSELNTTVVTYENGARLAYRQTQITENVVQLNAVSPGGFFAVEEADVSLLSSVSSLTSGSGFESVDAVTLDRLLADSIVSLNTFVGRSTEGIRGEASTSDLETLFQLTYLSMTEPIISDLRARQFDERWRPLVLDPQAQPAVAADMALWQLRYGDSPWFRYIPTIEDLNGFDKEALLATRQARFANAGDFVFVVVGDFEPDALVELGARYLGTLPDDGVREELVDRDPGVPEQNLIETVQAGIGDQGRVRINWESPYPFTLQAQVAAAALEVVVNARLRDLIREQLSASYSPNASVSVLAEPKSWVDSIIEIDSDPERVVEVSDTVRAELERIRNGDFDEQYLLLAIEQLADSYRFSSNRSWSDLITFHLLHPERSEGEFRQRTDIVRGLTVDDMAQAAQLIFPESRSVEVRLLPGE